jgi:hypothetical protein
VKRYRVIITPAAGENLREANDGLETENPVYAAKWLNAIREKILEPPPQLASLRGLREDGALRAENRLEAQADFRHRLEALLSLPSPRFAEGRGVETASILLPSPC